jgi:hypothetical protein
MIDYIALGLGHGLIAFVLVRLFMRHDVDFDPLIGSFQDKQRDNRNGSRAAGRAARRRAPARRGKSRR